MRGGEIGPCAVDHNTAKYDPDGERVNNGPEGRGKSAQSKRQKLTNKRSSERRGPRALVLGGNLRGGEKGTGESL